MLCMTVRVIACVLVCLLIYVAFMLLKKKKQFRKIPALGVLSFLIQARLLFFFTIINHIIIIISIIIILSYKRETFFPKILFKRNKMLAKA